MAYIEKEQLKFKSSTKEILLQFIENSCASERYALEQVGLIKSKRAQVAQPDPEQDLFILKKQNYNGHYVFSVWFMHPIYGASYKLFKQSKESYETQQFETDDQLLDRAMKFYNSLRWHGYRIDTTKLIDSFGFAK